jgi:hypothetical protein
VLNATNNEAAVPYEICFYHQAYKNEKATIKTIETIRNTVIP